MIPVMGKLDVHDTRAAENPNVEVSAEDRAKLGQKLRYVWRDQMGYSVVDV